ncbi:MAG: hypothetical protein SGPRY_003220, partial [Prymnesium sp.]
EQAVGTAGEAIFLRVRRSMERALPSVDAFVTGILIYVLSQLWYDLLSTYLLQLHPVPYCGSEATRPCCAEAGWRAHATFALQLLLSLGVVDRILAFLRFRSRRLESTFRARIYAPLAGMCVGWAFGSASVQYIRSLDDVCAGCVWIKLLFAALVTLLSSFAILVLQSLFDVLLLSLAVAVATLRSCEGHCISASLLAVARLLRQLEALLSSLMRLLTKALTTLVMILWNFALSKAVVVNLSSEDLERVGPRLWFLWSLSLTFGLSGVSVALARFRLSLERQQAASQIAREQRESTLCLPQGRSPVDQPSVCELLCRAVRRQCSGLNYRAELISLCAVLEATFGWVTGCAWTNYVGAIWSSLDEYPTALVFFYDLLASLSVTLLAVGWLVWCEGSGSTSPSSSSSSDAIREREHVEFYFITTSMCFFVGWCYITCIRDLTTLVAALLGTNEWSVNFAGETILMALFAFLLTAALLKLSTFSLRTYSCAAATPVGEQGGAALRHDPMVVMGPPLGGKHVHAVADSVVAEPLDSPRLMQPRAGMSQPVQVYC